MGAPSKYKTELNRKLIDHMKKGLSFESFAPTAKVDKRTLYRWVDDHPLFARAKDKAEAACLLFFEQILANKVIGKQVRGFTPSMSDTTLLIFALKTRFHKIYGDKANLKVEHSGNIGQELDYSKLSKDQLETFIELAEKAKVEKK